MYDVRDLKQRRRRRQRKWDLKVTFALISTHLVCVMWPNDLGANVVGAALKFRKRKEN